MQLPETSVYTRRLYCFSIYALKPPTPGSSGNLRHCQKKTSLLAFYRQTHILQPQQPYNNALTTTHDIAVVDFANITHNFIKKMFKPFLEVSSWQIGLCREIATDSQLLVCNAFCECTASKPLWFKSVCKVHMTYGNETHFSVNPKRCLLKILSGISMMSSIFLLYQTHANCISRQSD